MRQTAVGYHIPGALAPVRLISARSPGLIPFFLFPHMYDVFREECFIKRATKID